MNICIISDEKQGHLSQCQGLAEALMTAADTQQTQREHHCYEWSVKGLSFCQKLFYHVKDHQSDAPEKMDLVLCAGHSTHAAALRIARFYKCLCMVCMKPSLPLSLFDLALIPEHDLPEKKRASKRIYPTKGALNNIHARESHEGKQILFLIGGESRDFSWDSDTLITQIEHITRNSTYPVILTTSRRTQSDFVHDVRQACPSILVVPMDQTGPHWIREHLSTAHTVWVTQDSVSMVYEALSSGAPVGILDMNQRDAKKSSRVTRGLAKLINDGYVSTYTYWAQHRSLPQKDPLNEAQRAAEYILERFPQLL